VNSDVANSGLIWAHGGNITINGAVTGPGSALIDGVATLGFGAASSVDVAFAADAAGTLTLKNVADFTGTISGFSSNGQIDLTNISSSIASTHNATYSSSTNITSLVITDGTSSGTIKLAGDYTTNTAWHFSGDGHGGTLLTDSLPGGGADLDQFTFQADGQGSTPPGDSTTAAPGQGQGASHDGAGAARPACVHNHPPDCARDRRHGSREPRRNEPSADSRRFRH